MSNFAPSLRRKPIDKRDGTIELVFNAVEQGVTDHLAMPAWLSLSQTQVNNALKRLVDAKRVRRDGDRYVVNRRLTALEEHWR